MLSMPTFWWGVFIQHGLIQADSGLLPVFGGFLLKLGG